MRTAMRWAAWDGAVCGKRAVAELSYVDTRRGVLLFEARQR